MNVKLVWATPNGDDLIAYMARVSNPANQGNTETAPKLIAYMIRKRHWSPFEMCDMCVEFTTERDISRQLLRHGKAFRFQEFSQRYQDVNVLPPAPNREARMQDTKNRQNSLPCEDAALRRWWDEAQTRVRENAGDVYDEALSRGIAKEVARVVLPEGLTPTRMYMKGDVRSWLHFCDLRCGPETQKETREIAVGAWTLLRENYPMVTAAWDIAHGQK